MNFGAFLSVGAFLSLTLMWSPAYAYSLKALDQAKKGCIPTVNQDQADAVIRRFNLRTINAKQDEVRALGTGLFWIEKLNGGTPYKYAKAKGPHLYPFQFFERWGASRQTGSRIEISRNGERQYGRNVAQLVHELGHFVGNQGAYAEYRDAMKGTSLCIVSPYSRSRFNENFAENFAAFVTYPAALKNNNAVGCQRSYAYFKKAFVKSELADKCAGGRLKADDYN